MKNGQAEALVPLIEQTMKVCEVSYFDLDRVAVTLGPGSFTGVRVGIATARAIGTAADIPVVGVKTSEVYAASAPETDNSILAAIDTKRGDLYVQVFSPDLKPLSDVKVETLEGLPEFIGSSPVTVVGDASRAASHALGELATISAAPSFPDVDQLAKLSSALSPQLSDLKPIYARAPEAKIPLAARRFRQ